MLRVKEDVADQVAAGTGTVHGGERHGRLVGLQDVELAVADVRRGRTPRVEQPLDVGAPGAFGHRHRAGIGQEAQMLGGVRVQGYNAPAISESTAGRRSMASQVQMWERCSGLVRQHMCSAESVHGISSIQV